MIKLETALDSFYTFTGKLSDSVRQFSFAGVAVVWLFKVGGENAAGISWDPWLIWPLGCFVLALTLDLIQYAYYSLVWGIYHREKEIEIQTMEEKGEDIPEFFYVSPIINRVGYTFFWGKTFFVVVGYILLLSHIFCRLQLH